MQAVADLERFYALDAYASALEAGIAAADSMGLEVTGEDRAEASAARLAAIAASR